MVWNYCFLHQYLVGYESPKVFWLFPVIANSSWSWFVIPIGLSISGYSILTFLWSSKSSFAERLLLFLNNEVCAYLWSSLSVSHYIFSASSVMSSQNFKKTSLFFLSGVSEIKFKLVFKTSSFSYHLHPPYFLIKLTYALINLLNKIYT